MIVPPLLVLEARASARALLLRCQHFETEDEAVLPLLEWARERGMAEEFGADVVWSIIDTAFHPAAETGKA
jgi:hypothetical protein